MSAIYKRELRSYFCSVTGYLFIAVHVVFIGIFFMTTNMISGYPYFSYSLMSMMVISSLTIPLLTMKCLADERKTKTDQMLLTYPVSITSVVLGKFFAVMTVVVIPLIISILCPLIIHKYGTYSYVAVDLATIFAYFILSGVYVSIGMFVSSQTENQIIAAVVSIFVLLLLFFWDQLVGFLPSVYTKNFYFCLLIMAVITVVVFAVSKSPLVTIIVAVVGFAGVIVPYLIDELLFTDLLSKLFGSFSLRTPLNNFANNNLFDIKGLLFYLTTTAVFIFLTVQSIEKRRWN